MYSILENKLHRRDDKDDAGRELKKILNYYEEHPVCEGGVVFRVG